MRSIVAPNPAPTWSSMLHATGRVTVIVRPHAEFADHGPDTTVLWDRKDGVVWLSDSLLGDDAAIDDCIRQAVTSTGTYHRPTLTAVAGGGDTTPAARPALRIVRD